MELLLILFICFLVISCIVAVLQTVLNLLVLLLPLAAIGGLLILNARIWAWKEQVKVEIRKKHLALDAGENAILREQDSPKIPSPDTDLAVKWK